MEEQVYSPLKGKLINIELVPDDMFSQKMLGDGVAIIPSDKHLYSPVDGVVTMVYDTQHAIGIKTNNGKDILIHIGIETVNLKGKPFKTKVKVGDIVKHGDLLTVVNWSYIKLKGCDTAVIVTCVDSDIAINGLYGKIKPGDFLFTV
jgi:glucose-specific phosphotransferase system IIA component